MRMIPTITNAHILIKFITIFFTHINTMGVSKVINLANNKKLHSKTSTFLAIESPPC